MEYLIAFLLLLVGTQLIYWEILRPILLSKISFQLDQLLFDLYMLAKRRGSQGAYLVLKSIAEGLQRSIEDIDIGYTLAVPRIPQEIKLRVERDLEKVYLERDVYGALNDRLNQKILFALLVNSPVFVVGFALWMLWIHVNKGKQTPIGPNVVSSIYCRA